MDLGCLYNPLFPFCLWPLYTQFLFTVSSDLLSTLSVHLFLVPSILMVSIFFLAVFRNSSFEHVLTVNTTNGPNNKTTYDRYSEQ